MNDNIKPYIGGSLNLLGAMPGKGFDYDGATMPDRVCYSITFHTTYEVIEKLILPPPLKADRNLPPEMTVTYFTNYGTLGFDGRAMDYQACLFTGHTSCDEIKGDAGWEYVDGVNNDKSQMDIMGSWGPFFGMLKKTSDIHFSPIGANRFKITVRRRGVVVVMLQMTLGQEVSSDVVAMMNDQGRRKNVLTVREIPSVDYSDLIDHSVCMTPIGSTATIRRAFSAHDASIEFGHLEMDPLDEIPVLEIANASVFEMSVSKEFFTGMRVLKLLKA